mgnify:CR=1 FL=1
MWFIDVVQLKKDRQMTWNIRTGRFAETPIRTKNREENGANRT